MATQQVFARVVDGISAVDETIRRPVRLTPDGFAGVVYGGAVYPLMTDNQVDLAGLSWEIEDCNRFLLSGTPIPYYPQAGRADTTNPLSSFTGQWSVESNPLGHYVVFDASERVAVGVIEALEAAGLSVQRWDVSHRPAQDGRFYDWFARLRVKGDHEEVVALVANALSHDSTTAVAEAPSQTETHLEELEAQVERLLDQTAELRLLLEASRSEADVLGRQLAASREREDALAAQVDRVLDHQRSLHEQIAALSAAQTDGLRTPSSAARLLETEELLELALAENADLLRGIGAARNQADHDESRILILEASLAEMTQRLEELGELERERRTAASARRTPRVGLEGFLDGAFARLLFVLDSVEVLANLEAPASVLRCLVRIDMGDLVGKDLEGLRGWREVPKLATGIAGSEDMGRVYYKPDGERVLVSVHIKHDDKEQRRHIERLRSVE